MEQRSNVDKQPDGIEPPRTELQQFLLGIRPHVIGILRAIDKACGTGQRCPHCGRLVHESDRSGKLH